MGLRVAITDSCPGFKSWKYVISLLEEHELARRTIAAAPARYRDLIFITCCLVATVDNCCMSFQMKRMKSGATSTAEVSMPGNSTMSLFVRIPFTERRCPVIPSSGPPTIRTCLPIIDGVISEGMKNFGLSVDVVALMNLSISESFTVMASPWAPPLTNRYCNVARLATSGSSSALVESTKRRS